MQRLDDESAEVDPVLAALDGDDCAYCEDGALTLGVYKGDDAVVCEECGAPGARSL